MNKQRRGELGKVFATIAAAMDDLETLMDEETDYRDNMPENLQGSEKYEAADAAVDAMSSAADSLQEALDQIEEAQA